MTRHFSLRKSLRVLIIAFIVVLVIIALNSNKSQQHNYFRPRARISAFENQTYIVDNNKCRIPDLDIWNPEIKPFMTVPPPFRCSKGRSREYVIHGLTYVHYQTIKINASIVKAVQVNPSDVTCCYRKIFRVVQSITAYDINADNVYKVSPLCYPLTSSPLTWGFVKVSCFHKGLLWTYPLHSDYHLLATLPSENEGSPGKLIQEKVKYWGQQTTRPPNVLILGLDTTSRMNFNRLMPKTRKILQEINAVEMLGFTKVGMNTLPNIMPLLTSFSKEELSKTCFSDETPQDNCPYIWKNFSSQNYLTAYIEDDSDMTAFNFEKVGFVQQPVDFYVRPWMLSIYEEYMDDPHNICVNAGKSPPQIVFNYAAEFAEMATRNNLPYFMLAWTTALAHKAITKLRLIDDSMEAHLRHLYNSGLLNNTLLILLGDHGARLEPIRRTVPGWYEDKLPALWIRIPESLKASNPDWNKALLYNSNQLLSPFDIHQTLKVVLGESNSSSKGLSLFEDLPERTCDQAHIPIGFCPCSEPKPVDMFTPFVQKAAEYAVHMRNNYWKDPNNKVGTILGAASIPKSYSQASHNEDEESEASLEEKVKSGENNLLVGFTIKTKYTQIEHKLKSEVLLQYNSTLGQFKLLHGDDIR